MTTDTPQNGADAPNPPAVLEEHATSRMEVDQSEDARNPEIHRCIRCNREFSDNRGTCPFCGPAPEIETMSYEQYKAFDRLKRPAAAKAAKNKTAFGRNVDRLRKECGWSFADLAKATEFDKKLILGHVNKGKGANPGTLATYAAVFTEKLGRPVTVAELEA